MLISPCTALVFPLSFDQSFILDTVISNPVVLSSFSVWVLIEKFF